MATVTIAAGVQSINLAPLKSSQVAAFLDAGKPTSQSETIVSNQRLIAQSITQAKDPFAQDLTLDELIAKIDDQFSWAEVNEIPLKVLEVTGLRKADPGEAPAAEDSTSSESTAAL